jgi:hypothetical protein
MSNTSGYVSGAPSGRYFAPANGRIAFRSFAATARQRTCSPRRCSRFDFSAKKMIKPWQDNFVIEIDVLNLFNDRLQPDDIHEHDRDNYRVTSRARMSTARSIGSRVGTGPTRFNCKPGVSSPSNPAEAEASAGFDDLTSPLPTV